MLTWSQLIQKLLKWINRIYLENGMQKDKSSNHNNHRQGNYSGEGMNLSSLKSILLELHLVLIQPFEE